MIIATIIGSASTQSRGRRPGKPVTLSYCSGAYEYSTDGRKILSWPMGQYGPLLGYPSKENLLTKELIHTLFWDMSGGKASLGSYSPVCEQLLADKLASIYAPYLRNKDIGIRFFSNGTDACQAAVALCRYATHRSPITSIGYHGGSSPVFAFAPQNYGVLTQNDMYREDIVFAKIDDYHPIDGDACVIVEIPSVEDELQAANTLKHIEDMCVADDVPLIMDEIVTGFRYAPAGALEYYSKLLNPAIDYVEGEMPEMSSWKTPHNIKADFICLGKAMSTYGKVSALLGPLDAMEALIQYVFASYTYNDHPLGFYDALWTLEQYDKYVDHLYVTTKTINLNKNIYRIGMKLHDELNKLFDNYLFPAKCIGHPSRSAIIPTDDSGMLGTLLARVVDEHDILLHRPQFVTLAHTLDDVSKTLVAVEKVLQTW